MQNWPEKAGEWMKYFEYQAGQSSRTLCRIENFLPYLPVLSKVLKGQTIEHILEELMEEKPVLFKEKCNFKMPGSAGFKAHQDAPAFTSFGQKYHITLMISVDPTTRKNGCLEVVKDRAQAQSLPMEKDLTLDTKLEKELTWVPLETKPGDVVLFNSYIPHRSGPNLTANPRRAFYITYNKLSEGSMREQYYQHKREVFPPECERIAGKDYSLNSGVYNVGNPIK